MKGGRGGVGEIRMKRKVKPKTNSSQRERIPEISIDTEEKYLLPSDETPYCQSLPAGQDAIISRTKECSHLLALMELTNIIKFVLGDFSRKQRAEGFPVPYESAAEEVHQSPGTLHRCAGSWNGGSSPGPCLKPKMSHMVTASPVSLGTVAEPTH